MAVVRALLIASMVAIPLAGAAAETPVVVQLEVQTGSGDYSTGLDGVTVRVDSAQSVDLRLRVFDPGDPLSPVDVDDPSGLLEIREAGDTGSGTRFADWKHVETGVYETSDVIDGTGEFLLLVLPDITDRSRLPEGSTDHVTLVVSPAAPTAGEGSGTWGLLIFLGAALTVAVLVTLATRGRRRVPKEPAPHDTWWNSP